MKFLDSARVNIRSGDGGAGCLSFRREKFIEFGGPDGGDGGRGGDVIAECAAGLNTLVDYRYQQHVKAATGMHGMGKNRAGGKGADAILKVPAGTQIFDEEGEVLLADLTEIGQRVRLARGGNGGFGNTRFKTSTNQAPRHANPGQKGEERVILLRLKLIADAGIIGLPNAGKSTFLATVSAARPRIADYPFTTLHPQLGAATCDGREFVVADIPGLIEGAHDGHGLGDRFLGHIERCRVLLHLVDAGTGHAGKAYKTVRRELEAYGGGLAEKPEIVALSKIDSVDQATLQAQALRLKRAAKQTPLRLSAVAGTNMRETLRRLLTIIDETQNAKTSSAGRRRGVAPLSVANQAAAAPSATLPSLKTFRRIVIKVGSSLLIDREQGCVRRSWLLSLAQDIADLHAQGADLLVVSSGAIALGRTVLGLPGRDLKLEDSQAAAAVGQIALARIWAEVLADRKITAGQILVTLGDTEERHRYLNARATIGRLLDLRAVPVINENDTVATSEIRYGDNDRLAARVATMASADLLILLSDVPGLYTAPPAETPRPSLFRWFCASTQRSRRWPAAAPRRCRAAACAPRSRRRKSRRPAAPIC